MYKKIFVDQCGYLPKMKKKVTFRAEKPVSFFVLKTDGTRVLKGKANKKIENASAGETNFVGDFSEITESGMYYIIADGLGESDTFVIGEDAFSILFQKAMAFFYLQRCGQDLPEKAAGVYAHKACHTQIGHIYGETGTMDVSGGWHDAGDYGRYVVPGAMTVAQLLHVLQRNPELCTIYRSPDRAGYDAACFHPDAQRKSTAKGIPDYLEELKYELDWMMKMQREDGALYHKATCRSFCGFIMPEEEQDDMLVLPVSVTATGDFAAVCAMAARIYQKLNGAYADKLKKAAKKAYKALKKMELPGGFRNPEGIYTGEYEDACDTDEYYWAAAEMYKTFGDKKYRDDFEKIARKKVYQGYGWRDMGSYGNLAYLSTEFPTDEELKKEIRKAMIARADKLLKRSEKDGYGTALSAKEYVWGSNMDVANNGLHLYDAWVLTGKKKYLDAAGAQLHYLLGRNPMGLCYVTGCGTDAIKHPHHRPSINRGKAMPGMLSGGPCSWIADETIRKMFSKGNVPAPAKCILDMGDSYSTNEITIYWNSAFLMLLASVMA